VRVAARRRAHAVDRVRHGEHVVGHVAPAAAGFMRGVAEVDDPRVDAVRVQ